MPFDPATDSVKAVYMQVNFFAVICQKCGLNHLFFINHTGQPSFLLGFDREAEAEFLTKHNLPPEYLAENAILICPCGLAIRLQNPDEEDEQQEPEAVEGEEKKPEPTHLKPVD